jgi:hypothetical protein
MKAFEWWNFDNNYPISIDYIFTDSNYSVIVNNSIDNVQMVFSFWV